MASRLETLDEPALTGVRPAKRRSSTSQVYLQSTDSRKGPPPRLCASEEGVNSKEKIQGKAFSQTRISLQIGTISPET